MLESKLRNTVPTAVSSFEKLEGGQPYLFDRWANDNRGVLCLYYRFSSRNGSSQNVKRVPLPEFRPALRYLRGAGILDRTSFRDLCPVAQSDGSCGFAVVGRILEALGVAQYQGRGQGFALINVVRADQLLG